MLGRLPNRKGEEEGTIKEQRKPIGREVPEEILRSHKS